MADYKRELLSPLTLQPLQELNKPLDQPPQGRHNHQHCLISPDRVHICPYPIIEALDKERSAHNRTRFQLHKSCQQALDKDMELKDAVGARDLWWNRFYQLRQAWYKLEVEKIAVSIESERMRADYDLLKDNMMAKEAELQRLEDNLGSRSRLLEKGEGDTSMTETPVGVHSASI